MSSTMSDKTRQHSWVKYTRTPVAAVPDPDDEHSIVVIEELTPEQTEDQAVFGCENCGVSMPGNTDSLCSGGEQ